MYILVIYTMNHKTTIDLSTLDGFERDDGNREKNRFLHHVEWTEAEEVFLSTPVLVLPDPKHSLGENRLVLLGRTPADRRLVVVFTIRNSRIRVISARDMSKKERKIYDEAIEENP
jgi:uncharacterized DUF497 family protein